MPLSQTLVVPAGVRHPVPRLLALARFTLFQSRFIWHYLHWLYDVVLLHNPRQLRNTPHPNKAMQIENNYDKNVYNGDIGFVTDIDAEEQELTATFDDNAVTYAFGELDELVLCYATTVHKSQGSEYPVVVIPISTQHYMMLKRNLIYTGITRGKRLVVLVGQKRALAIAVKGKQTERRWSKLAEWLSP